MGSTSRREQRLWYLAGALRTRHGTPFDPWPPLEPSASGPVSVTSLGMMTTEVVVEADDVVLAGVGAVLDLDDHELLGPIVGQSVPRAAGDVDRVSGTGRSGLLIDGRRSDAEDHHPVLAPVLMRLERQPPTRVHVDALDLVAGPHVDDVPAAPRSVFEVLAHHVPCRGDQRSSAARCLRGSHHPRWVRYHSTVSASPCSNGTFGS